jgi:flagellar FliJ protein
MAGRFRFRLEVVRRIRQQAQDAQRRVVADAARAVGVVEAQIDRLTHTLGDTVDRARETQRGKRLDLMCLRGDQFYRGWLHRRILESHAELSGRRADLDRARAELGELTKRLKVIEKLRERQWARYLKDIRREEQAAFDESALQMHLRKQREDRAEALAS